MTVQDLKAQLAAVAYPQFTESNVLSVSISDSRLVCETDQSELTEQLREQAQTVAELEKENGELQSKLTQAEDVLAEMEEDGKTVLDFKRQADEAIEARGRAESEAAQAQQELAAMRKRKGVHAGLFAQSDNVLRFVTLAMNNSPAGTPTGDAARVLWQNINAKR